MHFKVSIWSSGLIKARQDMTPTICCTVLPLYDCLLEDVRIHGIECVKIRYRVHRDPFHNQMKKDSSL